MIFCGGVIWHHSAVMLGRRAQPAAAPVVCIDPGHPSETNSARRVLNGTTELEVNWQVARKLRTLLRRHGIETVMTKKTRDQFISNRQRATLANEAKADLVLHLHCDAGPGRGFTIFYPDKHGTIRGKTGPPKQVINASRRAAWLLRSGMASWLGGHLRDRGIKGDNMTRIGRDYGTLTTSAFSDVPTLTVEMAFLTNRRDATFIKSQDGQWRMAKAISAGVVCYLVADGCMRENGRLTRQ